MTISRGTNRGRRGRRLLAPCACGASALCLSAVAGAPASAPAPPAKTRPAYYQVVANYDGVRLDVRVNDMPVVLSASEHGTGIHVVNNLLTGHDNAVTITAEPPRGKEHAPAGASILVNVTAFPGQGGGGGEGKVVFTYAWKMKDIHAPLPHMRGQFQATAPAEPLSWQDAALLHPATLDKAGINAQIKRLHEALAAKNVSETTALLSSEAHDQDVGFGLPHNEPDADQRKFYEELFSKPGWGLTPVRYDALEYDLYGGGRVVRAYTRGGGKTFKSMADKDGGSTIFDVYLSFINGHWVIVK